MPSFPKSTKKGQPFAVYPFSAVAGFCINNWLYVLPAITRRVTCAITFVRLQVMTSSCTRKPCCCHTSIKKSANIPKRPMDVSRLFGFTTNSSISDESRASFLLYALCICKGTLFWETSKHFARKCVDFQKIKQLCYIFCNLLLYLQKQILLHYENVHTRF